jgi:hypothetical protein
MEKREKTEKRVEIALRKIGFRTAAAFVVFLALAGLIWGAYLALEALGFSPGSKSEAVFGFLFIAVALALLSAWIEPAPVAGPGISLQVRRPKDLAGSDGVTTRERLVNLPYEIAEGMVLTLDDPNITDPPIFATVVTIYRSIDPPDSEWMLVTLELDDPKDFERLGNGYHWQDIREDTLKAAA